ncbi:MAG: AraC family transcriptional regulator [Acidobacteriota bacterium]
MLESPKDLLRSAASDTFDRIREDQEQVPSRLKPMLAYIEDHLFDPTLNVNRLKKACGIRDNSVAIHFHAAVGQPPHAYISHCRLETAARLLRDTELPVWKISDMLGFSSIQVFSRAFFRWSGQRPTAFRRKTREDGTSPNETHESQETEEYWRRAMSGSLRDEEAANLIQRLLELYPPGRR